MPRTGPSIVLSSFIQSPERAGGRASDGDRLTNCLGSGFRPRCCGDPSLRRCSPPSSLPPSFPPHARTHKKIPSFIFAIHKHGKQRARRARNTTAAAFVIAQLQLASIAGVLGKQKKQKPFRNHIRCHSRTSPGACSAQTINGNIAAHMLVLFLTVSECCYLVYLGHPPSGMQYRRLS